MEIRRRLPDPRWAPIAVVYLLASRLIFHHFPLLSKTQIPFSPTADQAQQVWFLGWVAYAVRHLQDPFFSTAMNFPHGINLLVNTAAPLLGILFSPLTWLAGPLATYVILLELGLALSALSAAAVARRLGAGWWEALFVGALYGFSARQLTSGISHVFLGFNVILPWVVLASVRLFQGRWSSRRFGLVAGALICVDYFISTERAGIELMMLAVVAVCDLVVHRREVVSRARFLAESFAWLAGTVVVVLGYPVWFMLRGPGSIRGTPHLLRLTPSTSLSQFVRPGPYALLRVFGTQPGPTVTPGDRWVGIAYLGWPLLVLVTLGVIRHWRDPLVRIGVVVAVVFATLSLGPSIALPLTNVRLWGPEWILQRLPVLQDIVPTRYTQVVVIVVALIAAASLRGTLHDRDARRWPPWATGTLAALCVVTLLPSHGVSAANTGTPAWMSSATARTELPSGSVVLSYPYPVVIYNTPLIDQAESGLWYRLIGGQAIVPDKDGLNRNVLPLRPRVVFDALYRATQADPSAPVRGFDFHVGPLPPLDDVTRQAFIDFVRTNHVDEVLWQKRGAHPKLALAYLRAAFGRGRIFDHGRIRVWRVSPLGTT